MDFFLPDSSRLLYARMRITNPATKVIPMYWWSNIAVTEEQTSRVIVPAVESYSSLAPEWNVLKVNIPHPYGEEDATYPLRNKFSVDYFFKTLDDERKYICQVDADGYGLVETSTSLLKGRKMFVWGDSQGGAKWRSFLADDGKSGAYDEIQCGLARTQYESLPMPPRTTWEWLEGYGAISIEPGRAHGDWAEARTAAREALDGIVTAEQMEKILNDTRAMAKRPADEKLISMRGWGALERYRRDKDGTSFMCDHLDFGEMNEEQSVWLSLLENGTVGVHSPDDEPVSYQKQAEWISMLKAALKGKDKDNWFAHYLYGTALVAEEDYEAAEEHLERSRGLLECAWNCYALAVLRMKNGDRAGELDYILRAYSYRSADLSLAKETFRTLNNLGEYEKIVELFESADEKIKENNRCLLVYAYALANLDRVDEAEDILTGGGKKNLIVPDIRECEETVTDLWFLIQKKHGLSKAEMGNPPLDFDFRMFANMD
jgi:tetratricopeptide (TPR) repeat protein